MNLAVMRGVGLSLKNLSKPPSRCQLYCGTLVRISSMVGIAVPSGAGRVHGVKLLGRTRERTNTELHRVNDGSPQQRPHLCQL